MDIFEILGLCFSSFSSSPITSDSDWWLREIRIRKRLTRAGKEKKKKKKSNKRNRVFANLHSEPCLPPSTDRTTSALRDMHRQKSEAAASFVAALLRRLGGQRALSAPPSFAASSSASTPPSPRPCPAPRPWPRAETLLLTRGGAAAAAAWPSTTLSIESVRAPNLGCGGCT